MRMIRLAVMVTTCLVLNGIGYAQDGAVEPASNLFVSSPDGGLRATFKLGEGGEPQFEVSRSGKALARGALGLVFQEGRPLTRNLRLREVRRASRDETYDIPVGKDSRGRDHHNELVVALAEAAPPHRKVEIALRAFDDGVAFRYVIPEQESLDDFVLVDELTRITLPGDPSAHLLPLAGYTTSYEARYETKPISEIAPEQLVGLPIVLESRGGQVPDSPPLWIAVTEADLTDYAGMYLSRVDGAPDTFAAKLSPLPGRTDGAKVIGHAPFASPWRVLMVADDLGRLLESQIVFNLNRPPAIADTSWIKTGKTTFPWWNGYVLEDVDFEPGLNTATHKHYIDFCAEYGIPYHSLDGTDTAWYGGPIVPTGPVDVTKAVPEIDLSELLRHAKAKGVRLRLWMHWRALRPQLDQALATYDDWGIEGIMVDFMDRDDQEMVKWYHEVAEKAAGHKLTVTWHGAYKPTGMERTWPNVLSYEGAFNQEYNKWDEHGTPPEHNVDMALVRMLAGPMDYHQGGMRNVLPADFKPQDKSPLVQGTRGHQLAMYIVYQNHLPMMVDYPSAYRGQPDLKFLVGIPTNWVETRVLRAEFGECVAIARRQGDEWYIGAMAARKPQHLEMPTDFLGDGQFRAEIWTDDGSAGPTVVRRSERTIAAGKTLELDVPASGGAAVRLVPFRGGTP